MIFQEHTLVTTGIRQLIVAGFCGLSSACFAADRNEIPLNFDTQIIRIFEAAQTAPQSSPQHTTSTEDRKVLARIRDKFEQHKMMLKNAVYRTDMGVIRMTWADDTNEDVVKVAYKTNKDPILGNSVYADKRQVIDVKIMYRTDADAYEYLRLGNMDNIRASALPPNSAVPSLEKTPLHYFIEGGLTNEQCRFCHVLVQNDGAHDGVFFPRYQEDDKERSLGDTGSLFRAEHFKLVPAASASALGLPVMDEDFLYQKVTASQNGSAEEVRFTRMVIELPQLIEVIARDNRQSICVTVEWGSRQDYVCADNASQKLSVRLTNHILTVNKGPKEYSEPYFEKN
jgi:hypothetical protein